MSRSSRIHLIVLGVYVALTPIAFLLGWVNSVAFVSGLSLWALVESRLATLEASRTKDALDEHEDETGTA